VEASLLREGSRLNRWVLPHSLVLGCLRVPCLRLCVGMFRVPYSLVCENHRKPARKNLKIRVFAQNSRKNRANRILRHCASGCIMTQE
jgi:hypothetical protein